MAAVAANDVIGQGGGLPWHLPTEEKHYHDTIRGKWAIVGRKSMATEKNVLPLAGLMILTRDQAYKAGEHLIILSLREGIELAREKGLNELIILGGSEVYRQTIDMADRMILSHLEKDMEGESYFPPIDLSKWDVVHETSYPQSTENEVGFVVREWHARRGH